MKYLVLLTFTSILAACDTRIQETQPGVVVVESNGTQYTGQLIFIERDGHKFAVFMNDHGAATMVEIQPK